MIINKNVAKAMAEHISCDCKCICSSTASNSNQINNRTCKCDLKIIVSAKTIIVGILAHVFERIANSEKVLLILYLTCVMKL